jgi:hypothetical protein
VQGEDAPLSDRPASFDGGVRGDHNPPRLRLHEYRDKHGWITVEIADGFDLFWPGLGR